ncbi:MAG: hypothetical protein KJN70_13195 [Eudoraea sp.]|nr:hypothetical protein [Eudoraea sp.]
MKNLFKKIIKCLPIILALVFIHSSNAQFIPKNEVEKQAAKLVQAYQAEVGMTVEQASEVYEKIVEVIDKENSIRNSELTSEQKKKSLMNLSKQETADMGTILDPKQFKEYKKMKKTLQPIKY